MAEKRIGLYLGLNSLAAVAVKGRDIVAMVRLELSSLDENQEKPLNDELRWEALINKALREVGAEGKKVYVSLTDKDFIFRLLEMPLMRKKEIESSLIYEIEKYIPFKIDELEWDYKYVTFFKTKKVDLSFVGIRETVFQRSKEILSRLGLKAVLIEPSCISLARVIKSTKSLAKFKNYAILDFNHSEAYLTFFQHDLPVFNRYMDIPQKEGEPDIDRFMETITFSFQYFRREFKGYDLQRLIVVSDSDTKKLASSLPDTIGSPVEVVSSHELTSRNNAQLEITKALGAARLGLSPYKLIYGLKKTRERTAAPAFTGKIALRVGLLSGFVGAGLIICIILTIIMGNEVNFRRTILKTKAKSIIIPIEFEGKNLAQREVMVVERENKIVKLEVLSKSYDKLSGFIQRLSLQGVLPNRLWLDTMEISAGREGYTATLTGYIFRDDDYEESLGLNEFISNLRKDPQIEKIFPLVEPISSDKRELQGFAVTNFSIKLYQGRNKK